MQAASKHSTNLGKRGVSAASVKASFFHLGPPHLDFLQGPLHELEPQTAGRVSTRRRCLLLLLCDQTHRVDGVDLFWTQGVNLTTTVNNYFHTLLDGSGLEKHGCIPVSIRLFLTSCCSCCCCSCCVWNACTKQSGCDQVWWVQGLLVGVGRDGGCSVWLVSLPAAQSPASPVPCAVVELLALVLVELARWMLPVLRTLGTLPRSRTGLL
jgi:hypothetical protein